MALGLFVAVALNLLEEVSEYVFTVDSALPVNERKLFERLNRIDEFIKRKLLPVNYKLLFKVFLDIELVFKGLAVKVIDPFENLLSLLYVLSVLMNLELILLAVVPVVS